MSLRVNHNTGALNSWRNLERADRAMDKTLEKLSSGYKINRAGDDPAGLVVSEQMRSQIKSMEQAALNSELAISMIQTSEASINEVSNILVNMRQLTLHAANEGANDDKMLAADQAEIANAIDTIDQISMQAQFGSRYLLDGSNGISGSALGEGLRFVRSDVTSQSSPAEGFTVDVTEAAVKARMEGTRALNEEEITVGGVEFTFHEGGKDFTYSSRVGETMEAIVNSLKQAVHENRLALEVGLTEDGRLWVEHTQYGSEPRFSAAVSVAGVLCGEADVLEEAEQGRDVQGTIGGESAYGEGQYLTAAEGTRAEGTVVEYTGGLKTVPRLGADGLPEVGEDGQPLPPEHVPEGAVYVSNNALVFQVGPNQQQTASVSLPSVNTSILARGVENESGYTSLREIDVTTLQGAQDALKMIDQAIYEISSARGELGAFQKNTLESNLENLRYASENLIASESRLRDTDMAAEMSLFTKQQILLASGTAMLGQANQTPKAVLSLLSGQ